MLYFRPLIADIAIFQVIGFNLFYPRIYSYFEKYRYRFRSRLIAVDIISAYPVMSGYVLSFPAPARFATLVPSACAESRQSAWRRRCPKDEAIFVKYFRHYSCCSALTHDRNSVTNYNREHLEQNSRL